MSLRVIGRPTAGLVLSRFGLGPKPGGPARIARDPVGALERELGDPRRALIHDPELPDHAEACALARAGSAAAEAHARVELRARFAQAMRPEVGFLERLVQFWSNHFSICMYKQGLVAATVGQLERDVIRRTVLGRFEDMLLGVYRHPAMLVYLDNDRSVGPGSPLGRRTGATYNENLARELLEIHTVGAAGGQTQADVIAAARVLTGWTVVTPDEAAAGLGAAPGRFVFRADRHEPGSAQVLGRRFPAAGRAQGEAMLRMLARHPATARHLAVKLIRHFITDTPTARDVAAVAAAYRSSGGSLAAVARALLELPSAFADEDRKVVPPYDMMVRWFRAIGAPALTPANDWILVEPLRALYHLPWTNRAPDGFSDLNAAWNGGDSLKLRLDLACYLMDGLAGSISGEPLALARSLFGTRLSAATERAVLARDNRKSALSVLLMAPEFHKR